MPVKMPPRTTMTLDEQRTGDEGKVISVRFNKAEWEQYEKDMALLDIGVDSALLKHLAQIGHRCLHQQLGEDTLRYLVSLKRTRYDGRKR